MIKKLKYLVYLIYIGDESIGNLVLFVGLLCIFNGSIPFFIVCFIFFIATRLPKLINNSNYMLYPFFSWEEIKIIDKKARRLRFISNELFDDVMSKEKLNKLKKPENLDSKVTFEYVNDKFIKKCKEYFKYTTACDIYKDQKNYMIKQNSLILLGHKTYEEVEEESHFYIGSKNTLYSITEAEGSYSFREDFQKIIDNQYQEHINLVKSELNIQTN
ncbi:MAG: hypothetical protein WCO06_06360 [Candidatus Roizmanbacteria bacterium]